LYDNNKYNQEFGKRLRTARKNLKMTMKELGEKVKLHESTIQRYENGAIKTLDIEKAKDFAKALNVSMPYLMGWDKDDHYHDDHSRKNHNLSDIDLSLSEDTILFLKELDKIIEKKKPTREETIVAANHIFADGTIDFNEIPLEHHENINLLTELFKRASSLNLDEIKRLNQYIQELEAKRDTPDYLLPNAAHEIEGASEDDKAHDNAIMDDDDF